MKFKNVTEVASWRLCIGCGACAYICPDDRITLVDVDTDGIRPRVEEGDCKNCTECIKVCPGVETVHRNNNDEGDVMMDLKEGWGPVLEVWEGYATDNEIRYKGSSGGVASALALYCLEREGMDGVLHVDAHEEETWRNRTVFSHTRADILSRTGSRYSPASPCEGLKNIESGKQCSAFIGKPCDIAGLRKAQSLKMEINKKVGVAIGIFCAGTPSTRGTLDLLKSLGLNPDQLHDLRYRGNGWPGLTTARSTDTEAPPIKIPYMDAWGFVQKYRPYRCYLCPDGTSEFADISCGDPWYREIKEDEPGYSLILVRSEKGREIFRGAVESGYVTADRADSGILEKSQKNLLEKRRAIWGRLFGMKALMTPTPCLSGFSLFHNWLKLPAKQKLKSIFGTCRRVVTRKYYRKLELFLEDKKDYV